MPTQAANMVPPTVAMAHVTQMSVEDMWIDDDEVDMSSRDLGLQVLTKLGFRENGSLQELCSNHPDGRERTRAWALSSSDSQGLILKLVDSARNEPEKFMKIQAQYPDIVKELAFAFPVKILRLRGPLGDRVSDLIVMRRAPGEELANIIERKWQNGEKDSLYQIFTEFATFLKTVHKVYSGVQHGKCEPSAIFYEEASHHFTFTNVASLGLDSNDAEHFEAALNALAEQYGTEFAENAVKAFKVGC